MRRSRNHYAFLVLGAAALMAAGCERPRSELAEDTVATRAPETAPPVTGRPTLVSVDLGKAIGADKKVVDETNDFAPRDTIYASIHTMGDAPNATLTARWLFEDGQVVDSSSQTLNLVGDAFTEFHIMKPTAWPVGKYRLEILLNGERLGDESFEIKSKTDR